MNALATMVHSAVVEMKAMNRPIDQLSEDVNLEDEDPTANRENWSTEMLTENQLFLSIQRSTN